MKCDKVKTEIQKIEKLCPLAAHAVCPVTAGQARRRWWVGEGPSVISTF